MADFSSLKQTIQTYIKQNGNEEITGNILQDVLLAMVTTMGDSAINGLISALQDEITERQNQDGTLQGNIIAEATARQQADTALGGSIDGLQTAINGINTKLAEGYIYAGIATPSTNPGTLTGKVFYIAVQAGTYTDFGNTKVKPGISILKYNGSAWSNEQVIYTDGGVFDVSAYNGGATYASLEALLSDANLSTIIPSAVRKGGMIIKFVQSSDNKYVQYRLMSDTFSTTESDWQGVDNEPTAGSDNLVKSGGVEKSIHLLSRKVNGLTSMEPVEIVDGKFMLQDGEHSNSGLQYWKFAIEPNKIYYFSGRYTNTVNIRMVYVYSASNTYISSYGLPDTEEGVIYSDESFVSPANAAFAYINVLKIFNTAFGFAKDSEDYGIDLINRLSLKSYGLYPMASYDNYFYDNRGLVANKSFVTIKYKVDGNRKYRFSGKLNAGANISFLTYADINDEFLSYSGKSGSLTEDVIFNNEEILTPYNAVYAYFAIKKSYYGYYKFETVNLSEKADYSSDNVLYANKTVLVPEITDNKFDLGFEQRSNVNFQMWKYSISPDKIYCITNMFNNSNIGFAYWYDANNNFISYIGVSGELNKVTSLKDYILLPPENAAYLNVNYRKGIEGVEVCEYNSDDRTDELKDKLYRYGHCKLGAGVYYINNLIMPANSRLEGCGDSSIIMLGGTSDGYAVRVSKYNQIANIRFMGAVQDLAIEEPADINTISIGNRHGVLQLGTGNDSDVEGNQIANCEFRNFTGGGITGDNTGYSIRKGLIVSDCRMQKCGTGINAAYWSEFNKWTNVVVNYCSYGAIVNSGNNSFVNCDFSGNGIGVYFNGKTDKAIRWNGSVSTATNTAHGLFTGCTIDHSGFNGNDNPGYAIVYLDTVGGELFTGIQLHYGKVRFANSDYIQICNIKFGKNIRIEATSNNLVIINQATFSDGLSGNICTDDTFTTRATNYAADGNLPKVKLINSYSYGGSLVTIQTINHD